MKKFLATIFLLSINTYTTPPLVRAGALINRIGSQRVLLNKELSRKLHTYITSNSEKEDFKCEHCTYPAGCPAVEASRLLSIDSSSQYQHFAAIQNYKHDKKVAWFHPLLIIPAGVCYLSFPFNDAMLFFTGFGGSAACILATYLVKSKENKRAQEPLENSCKNLQCKLRAIAGV